MVQVTFGEKILKALQIQDKCPQCKEILFTDFKLIKSYNDVLGYFRCPNCGFTYIDKIKKKI